MTRLNQLLVCTIALLALADLGSGRSSGQDKKPDDKPAEKAAVKVAAPVAKAAIVRPARPARVVVNDQMVQQYEQAYGAQFRLMYKAELHFMRLIAEPTKQQFEKIAGDGDAAVKSSLRAYAESMYNRGGGEYADPRTAMFEQIAKGVRETLTPDQSARYQKELELRTASLKRTVVNNLLASMDTLLILRAEQREKLREILNNNWNESWNQTQILMYGGQYWPAMPDDKIMPVLSVAQQAVWRNTQKGNVNFGFQLHFMQGIQLDDEVWELGAQKK